MADQNTTPDIVSEEYLSKAIQDLLNDCPLISGDVSFASLPEVGGIAFYPTGGAVVLTERASITDHISQTCAYSFSLVAMSYGENETRKRASKELLDRIGAWLEKRPVTDGEQVYLLDHYPTLTNGRKITAITRQTAASLDSVTEAQSYLWSIALRAEYRTEYDRIPD